MTCIAGIASGGSVWIGGDSAGVAGLSLSVRADEKVFAKGAFLFGFTSSFRMGDLLRFAFKPSEQRPSEGDRDYLCTTFIDELRACLNAGGYKKVESGVESGGTFLVGYRGALYCVQSDFQVGLTADGYDAVGCGADVALGSLFSTVGQPEQERVLSALSAAERHSAGVRGPFQVVSAVAPSRGPDPLVPERADR